MHFTRLRDLREDKDMKQVEIAEKLGIHQTTYSDYELGNLNVPITTLSQLAEFYNTSTDYILGLTNELKPYPKSKK